MPEDPFAGKAEWFAEHYGATRGRLRLELVLERIGAALPTSTARVLDAGGGTGAFAVPLARMGHHVTVLDRSGEWLAQARRAARAAGVDLRLVVGRAEDAARILGEEFDVVLCHTLLAYAEHPPATLSALRGVAARGAFLSLLEKNRPALPVRPGLQGDYEDARRLLHEPYGSGRLGIVNRAFSPAELRSMLVASGWRPRGWAGIRIFTDQAEEEVSEETFRSMLELEREASTREPYRRLGRLVHLIAKASTEPAPSLGELQERSFGAATTATIASWPRERALGPADLDAFLERKRYAVLSTTRPDGRPHAAMVAFVLRDGSVWLPAVAGSARLRNLQHEPSGTLVVSEGEEESHLAVVVEGDVVVHDDVEQLLAEFLRDDWKRKFGTMLDWAGAVVELVPSKVLSHDSSRDS
jgi:S-adenosylmethionine-dependent methyltransferase